uniref:Secreted protein n=1 Tax=Macaca mulatta TaxID=9544 RepID=A0A1D5Q4R4_MACMU
MIFCSSHFLPFLLLSHFPLLGVATCSCPPTLVYGDSGVRAATLSFPPAEQQTQQEHPHPHLVRSGLGFGRGGQTLGRGLGRERQLFLQLALIRLQSPSPPPPPCWETTALSQHYCDSHEPIAHNPSTLGHPDLWL